MHAELVVGGFPDVFKHFFTGAENQPTMPERHPESTIPVLGDRNIVKYAVTG
jgi:hypothetical protein